MDIEQFIMAATEFLESYDPAGDLEDTPIPDADESIPKPIGDDKLLNEVNAIYTPVLINQKLSSDSKGQILEACAECDVLTEANVIQFDTDSKRAQLESLCSLLIARQSNSPAYKAYKQAANVRKTMKLKIQEDNKAAAASLASRYLNQVASTSSNQVVRQAATDLL